MPTALYFSCKDPGFGFARDPREGVLVNRGNMDIGLLWERVPASSVAVGDLVSVPCVLDPSDKTRKKLVGAATDLVRATVVSVVLLG